ncbi:MAG: SDR family NAD(P)-dependent oxidoreductase [Spirochaetaceae bacterium]
MDEDSPQKSTASLSGYRALVVGGSGGIGRGVSTALASAGADVLVHGRRRSRVDATVRAIRAGGGRAEPLVHEISAAQPGSGRESSPAEGLIEALPAPPRFDILVAAFGPILYRDFNETSLTDYRRMAELNYLLPVALVQACAPAMIDRGFGRIVLFGGTATARIKGFTTIPAYSAAKTALGSFVKSAARNFRGSGVTINALCPDHVHTEYLTEQEIQGYSHQMPYGRLVTVEEVVSLVSYLMTPQAASINGQLLVVDQGRQR